MILVGKSGGLIIAIMVIIIIRYHIYMKEYIVPDMIHGKEKKLDMIYGISSNVNNIDSNFTWNEIQELVGLRFNLVENDLCEQIAIMEMIFSANCQDGGEAKVKIKFVDVNDFTLNGIGKYNQILGFEIIDNKARGWEQGYRYFVNDFENSVLQFYCEKIEIINIIK